MRLYLIYKIAKEKGKEPIYNTKNLQKINVPAIQEQRTEKAKENIEQTLSKMITPHAPIDALKKESGQIDYSMTKSIGTGNYFSGNFINRQNRLNYIKRLFEDNVNNNFNVLGLEDVLSADQTNEGVG